MSADPVPADPLLRELLGRWCEARARGEPVSPEGLCREHPHLLDSLRREIDGLEGAGGPEIDPALKTVPMSAFDRDTEAHPDADIQERDALRLAAEYADLRFHDEGGLGIVYRAADRRMHREVAVKFLRERYAGDEEARARFLLEAEVTARLEHPGTIPVHGVGETEQGQLFYAMRFIDGRKFTDAITEYHAEADGLDETARHLRFRDLLSRFVSVCHTVAYAHTRGIVHRDIKPSNIILGRYGETLLADWGLALPVGRGERFRVANERTLVPSTASGKSSASGGGTPAYMSPEQHAESPDISPASDIYSLGATLYMLLTGRPPVSAETPYFLIKMAVMSGRIRTPRDVNPGVPPALEAICGRAMAIDPDQRYATALDLAADIASYLADEPVGAYREPRSQQLARWVRRHKTGALVGLVSLLFILGLTVAFAVGMGRLAHRESQARQRANQLTGELARSQARTAAGRIASDINLRLLVLREDAADLRIRELLTAYNAGVEDPGADAAGEPAGGPREGQPPRPLRREIQEWLEERARQRAPLASTREDGRRKDWAANWFVVDHSGVQIARFPRLTGRGEEFPSLGRNFAYRSYFTALPVDLPPGSQALPFQGGPEKTVHISSLLRSVADGYVKVAFTTPIRSPEGAEIVGVLGLTIDVAEFAPIDVNNVSLVDLREDRHGRGIILHHRRLEHAPLSLASEGDWEAVVPRVAPELVQRMQRVRKARLAGVPAGPGAAAAAGAGAGGAAADNLLRSYRDPLDPSSAAPRLAAFEPVIVEGNWPEDVRDTGWVVVVSGEW